MYGRSSDLIQHALQELGGSPKDLRNPEIVSVLMQEVIEERCRAGADFHDVALALFEQILAENGLTSVD